MLINIGELNKRITIVRVDKYQDADGYWTADDVPVHSTWAKYSESSGKEAIKNDADYLEVIGTFLIRRTNKALSRKMVVLFDGKRYEIEHIAPFLKNSDFMLLTTKLLTLEG